MKICFISPEVPPYLSGGAGVATLRFSKTLVKRGFQVTIIARKLAGGNNYETVSGVDVYQLPCTKIRFLMLSHVIFFFRTLLLLWRLNRNTKERVDLYYSQTLLSPGLITAFCRTLFNTPTIVHGRGIDIEKGFEGIKKFVSLWVLKNNDYVFMLSNIHREKVQEIFHREKIDKDVFLLTNGVEVEFNKTKEECRKIVGFNQSDKESKTNIVYIGRLDPPKGLRYALEAVRGLKNVKLHIIGEETSGKKTETIWLQEYVAKHNLQEKVIFYGTLSKETANTYCKAADIFIHPLLIAAGMGNAFLEAMYFGTPVIGTNIGYFKEIIRSGESGLLVEPGNAKELEKAIKKMQEDKEFRQKCSRQAKAYVDKHHSWEMIAQQFEDFLKEKGLENRAAALKR